MNKLFYSLNACFILIILCTGCSKDADLILSQKELNNKYIEQSSINFCDGNPNTTSWKPKYDAFACITTNNEPGRICIRGGGGTCSGPTGCESILTLKPELTIEEAFAYWNQMTLVNE